MIRIVTWFTWLLVFGWACVAHASPVPPVDPLWSTDRIARLPREVRERVLFACGPHARAGRHLRSPLGRHPSRLLGAGMPRPVEVRRRDRWTPPDLRQTCRQIRLVAPAK